MSDAWSHAVVVDPRELKSLADEVGRLQNLSSRQRLALAAIAGVCIVASAAVCVQSSRLSFASSEAREYRKTSVRANVALTALAKSHEQILSATEQAPSVGTKSWGRRFTVTKYLPKSPAYGKSNDGLTSTLVKADPDARIIAVDPKLIPYGSWVWVEDLGWYQAQDCGSAIKGFRLDVLTATEDDAMTFGKQERFVIVVPAEGAV